MIMEKNQPRSLSGIFGIILGIVFIVCLYFININKLIIPIADFFLGKYFIVILILNCGVYLITFGFLTFYNILTPYHSESITKRDKAKHHFLSVLFSMPTWLAMASTVFLLSDSLFWKVTVALVVVAIVVFFVSSLKELRK